MRALGYRPDPPDPEDFDALGAITTASPPPSASTADRVLIVDQGALGSCTSNAVGQAVRVAEIKLLIDHWGMTLEKAQARVEFMARLFPWYFARALEHETQVNAGTHIRYIFQILNTFGFPPESAWPYSDDTDPKTGAFAKMPSSAAFRRAFDQRLAAENGGTKVVKYSRISSSGYARVTDVQRAVADGMLVVFGTDVSNDFCNDMTANGGRPIEPPTGGGIAGGHAMAVGAYDQNGADIVNSWSERFGINGWCRFSWDYIAWDRTRDLWIVERAPILAIAA